MPRVRVAITMKVANLANISGAGTSKFFNWTNSPQNLWPQVSLLDQVVEWIKYGLSYLDPYATILGVERFLDRTYYPEDGSSPIPLGVVIDLLLLRTDSNGQRFIEIIDYKTGRNLDGSVFTPVISRFVLKRLIEAQLPGEGFAPVVFTELYVSKQHVRSSELTLERCLTDWEEVKRTLAAIAAESTWAPTPSPLCEWCPFNGNGCNPTREEENLALR